MAVPCQRAVLETRPVVSSNGSGENGAEGHEGGRGLIAHNHNGLLECEAQQDGAGTQGSGE